MSRGDLIACGDLVMSTAGLTVAYVREHALRMTTTESCSASKIVTLPEIKGSGEQIESGYVVICLRPNNAY